MKNDPRIEEVLNSTKGLQRAEVPDFLWDKIKTKLQQETKMVRLVPKQTVWMAAASVALLVVLNVLALRSYKSSEGNQTGVELLIEQYQIK